jgi:hypothetical protein
MEEGCLVFICAKYYPSDRPRKITNIGSKYVSWLVKFVAGKGLVGLANFGQCHHLHGVSWLERTILRCSHMSSDYLGICFVQLDGETKRQMPWKVGHSSSFFRWKPEEDEQFFQIDVVLVFFIIVFWFEICS